MKNGSQSSFLRKSDFTKNNSSISKENTTDVNILLNRVRLNEKQNLKKQLTFLTLLILTTVLFGVFVIS